MTVGILAAAAWLQGCGAPTKSAGDVAYLFSDDGRALEDKVQSLCDALADRNSPPTTDGMVFNLGSCGDDAGKSAVDLPKIDRFHFVGFDPSQPPAAEQLIHKSVRAQVYLNKSLLGFAQALSARMKEKEDGGNTGVLALPETEAGKDGGLEAMVQREITIIEEPKLDVEELEFTMKIGLKMTGVVNIDNVIAVDGKLIDGAFGVTIRSGDDQPYEKSLIKNFSAVLLIVPHAGDVYMDLFVDLMAHNPGLGALFNTQLDSFLSTGLKAMIDGLLTL
jgi:hypothetical protein